MNLPDKSINVMTVLVAILLFTMMIVHQLREVNGLLLRSVSVPTHPVAGQSVSLGCEYDLGDDELYSVKWYKTGEEFYRYLPNDTPPMQIYDVDGIRVELNTSNDKTVTLREIGLRSTGTYRCEISAESPSFTTVSGEKEMNVIAIPSEGPEITGAKSRYDTGDKVSINCTSFKSKPAAMLTWTINGHKVQKEYLEEYATGYGSDDQVDAEDDVEEESQGGLVTSTLGLRFTVHESHFKAGEMRLRCSATIAPIYHQSHEAVFLPSVNQLAAVMESKSKESLVKVHTDHENGGGGNGGAMAATLCHVSLWSILVGITVL